MSRYLGPRLKKARAVGIDLPGLTRNRIDRKVNPPGQHGGRMRKLSNFGLRLREKQRLRFNYGLSEKQLRNLVEESMRGKSVTGDKLMELIERRLDNVVFRAGYAPTIPAARQPVNHGHFTVNGKRVFIASFRVKVGDVIAPRAKSKDLAAINETLSGPEFQRPAWLSFDDAARSAKMVTLPTTDTVLLPLDLQLIVEFYSASL